MLTGAKCRITVLLDGLEVPLFGILNNILFLTGNNTSE